jgi:hypothetical protein
LIALNYVGNGSPNIQLALNYISMHKSHNDFDSNGTHRFLSRCGKGGASPAPSICSEQFNKICNLSYDDENEVFWHLIGSLADDLGYQT